MSKRNLNWTEDDYAAHQAKFSRGRKLAVVEQKPEAKPKRVIRQSSRGPNVTETRFEQTFLKWDSSIRVYEFEAITLKLANGCIYKTDWLVETKEGAVIVHEVKGKHHWDDAIVKLKVAASKYRWIEFHIHKWIDGQWISQEVLP